MDPIVCATLTPPLSPLVQSAFRVIHYNHSFNRKRSQTISDQSLRHRRAATFHCAKQIEVYQKCERALLSPYRPAYRPPLMWFRSEKQRHENKPPTACRF